MDNTYKLVRTSNDQLQHVITVEGRGKVTAMPDKMMSTIGIRTEHVHVQEAQQENARVTNGVIQALLQIGIPNNAIATVSYTMEPRYDYIEGQAIERGYEVEHLLEVTVRDLQQAGQVYDVATRAGANVARNLQFQLTNEETYYQQALQLAM